MKLNTIFIILGALMILALFYYYYILPAQIFSDLTGTVSTAVDGAVQLVANRNTGNNNNNNSN